MSEYMFENDKEVLQGHVIGIEHTSILEGCFYEFFDDKFRDVYQVASFNYYWITRYKKKIPTFAISLVTTISINHSTLSSFYRKILNTSYKLSRIHNAKYSIINSVVSFTQQKANMK